MTLFDLFKIARTVELKNGVISLMGAPVNMIPTDLLKDVQDDLIKSIGFSAAHNLIYKNAKIGAQSYNEKLITKYNFKNKRDILEWQKKVVMLGGWGKWAIQSFNPQENTVSARFTDSPFTKAYSRSKYPVDIIPAGFSAGGIAACFGTDLDCIETKCMAMGDPYCEIFIGPPQLVAEKKQAIWEKWKLI